MCPLLNDGQRIWKQHVYVSRPVRISDLLRLCLTFDTTPAGPAAPLPPTVTAAVSVVQTL